MHGNNLYFQGHCLAYEHGSSACDLRNGPANSWQHTGRGVSSDGGGGWSNRQHAQSHVNTSAAPDAVKSGSAAAVALSLVVSAWWWRGHL